MSINFGKYAALVVFLFFLTELNGCGTFGKGTPEQPTADAAPATSFDADKIPNATPKAEPRSKSGNKKTYVVKGHRYYVLKSASGYHKRGYASWYGTKFHGKQTSNKESYNLYGMTAASPVLPIPTYVKVTNLKNGKKIIVKINDRGPFKKNRILDLSYAAAKKLGFASKGVALVDVEALNPKTWKQQFAENNYCRGARSCVSCKRKVG